MSKATETMRDLIEETATGDPDDRDLWVERGLFALSQELGPDSSEVRRFAAYVRGGKVKSDFTIRTGAYDRARSEGIQKAVRILMAVSEARGVGTESPAPIRNGGSGGPMTKVFFVHGRDATNNEAMTRFLESLGLLVIQWEEAVSATEDPNPYVSSIIEKGIEMADAVMVMFTADEQAHLRRDLVLPTDSPDEVTRWQSRPNVMYEAGLAMANPHKPTVLVSFGEVRMFSDLLGLHIARFDDSETARSDLLGRLQVAGLDLRIAGGRWLKAGDFEVRPPQSGSQPEREHPEAPSSDESADQISEPPGTVESLAAMEDAGPRVVKTIKSIGEGADELTALMQAATKEAQEAQSSKQRLAALLRFSRDITPIVDEEETRALEFHEYVEMMNHGVNLLLDGAESGAAVDKDEAEATLNLLQVIVDSGEQTRSLSVSVGDAVSQLPRIGTLARPLKAQTQRLEGAYRMHQGTLKTIEGWAMRAQGILDRQ